MTATVFIFDKYLSTIFFRASVGREAKISAGVDVITSSSTSSEERLVALSLCLLRALSIISASEQTEIQQVLDVFHVAYNLSIIFILITFGYFHFIHCLIVISLNLLCTNCKQTAINCYKSCRKYSKSLWQTIVEIQKGTHTEGDS
jgi:hypothetical protein